jgi:hypothetical protein
MGTESVQDNAIDNVTTRHTRGEPGREGEHLDGLGECGESAGQASDGRGESAYVGRVPFGDDADAAKTV